MFDGLAQGFYKQHYKEKISPHLTLDQKQILAHKISDLTLIKPIWTERDTDYRKTFPVLKPYVNYAVSGLYLISIYQGLVEDLLGVQSNMFEPKEQNK